MLKFIDVWCHDVDMFTATIKNYKITDANIALEPSETEVDAAAMKLKNGEVQSICSIILKMLKASGIQSLIVNQYDLACLASRNDPSGLVEKNYSTNL